MANISELPADLKDLARQVPEDVFRDLHQGESEHRLRHVATMLTAAESLPAEPHRHATASARKHLKAMPNAQFVSERNRLEGLKNDARSAGHSDLARAWMNALDKLKEDHPQAPGVQEAMMKWDKANPEDMPVAKATGRVSKAVERELERVQAEFFAKQETLRREIAEFREEMARRGRR